MDSFFEALLAVVLAPLGHLLEKAAEVLLTAILEPLASLLGHMLMGILCYVIALPIICIVSTPMVLITALFGSGGYADKVITGYQTVLLNIPFDIVSW